MKTRNLGFILEALLAAVFFGASAPVAKLLLGDIAPIFLAAFLYLGSGSGIALVKLTQWMRSKDVEAGIKRADVKWLAGAIVSGGILAPIVLMISLQITPASTASLLLNIEGVGTTLIALLFFKEAISRRAWMAILVITLASIFLSTDFTSGFGLSPGALGIILACMLWGLDNNFTRNISGKDPLAIVTWKGLVAGTFSFFLAWFLGNPFPSARAILGTLGLGFVSYGLSTMLFIRSMRGLGAARTSTLYGTAPLAGVLLSIVIFGELPSFMFIIAAILMIGGALLLINEEHSHSHVHTALFHDHSHRHDDLAHAHDVVDGVHSHEHEHPAEEHMHDHMPDIHHRHGHEE
ncbi:MAG TPA: DMT family transporter [Anaerolineales bacterium]|nr:DMT family transporter [Anaerolineales bacterium]